MTDEPRIPIPVPLPTTEDLKSPLLDAVNNLKKWTLVLYIALAVMAITTFVVRSIDLANVEEAATQNRVALCALRADLKDRVQSSKQFLREHPGGIPGIPPSQIRDSIRGQQRTIRALRPIDCSGINIELRGL